MFTDEEIEGYIFKACRKSALEDGQDFTMEDYLRQCGEEPEDFKVMFGIVKEILRLATSPYVE